MLEPVELYSLTVEECCCMVSSISQLSFCFSLTSCQVHIPHSMLISYDITYTSVVSSSKFLRPSCTKSAAVTVSCKQTYTSSDKQPFELRTRNPLYRHNSVGGSCISRLLVHFPDQHLNHNVILQVSV